MSFSFYCLADESCKEFPKYRGNTLCSNHFQLTINSVVKCYGCKTLFERTRSAFEGRYYCNECIDLLIEYKHLLIGSSTLSNHHITRVQYIKILISQDFHCLFCPVKSRLKIDHDHRCCPKTHSCGKCIRGLLCHRCNLVVSYFENSRGVAEQMEKYVDSRILVH